MTPDLNRPWKRLKWARLAGGFSKQELFADAAGVSHPTISNHERPPTSEGGTGRGFKAHAEKYAQILAQHGVEGITGDWLLHGDGPVPPKVIEALTLTKRHGTPAAVSSLPRRFETDHVTPDSFAPSGDQAHVINREVFDWVRSEVDTILDEQGLEFIPGKETETYLLIYDLVTQEQKVPKTDNVIGQVIALASRRA